MNSQSTTWRPGSAPIAAVMISYNEAHNMNQVLDNLQGWAAEVFLVDSFSSDETVEIARSRGVHVVQRPFQGFGDQWNYALKNLPISAPWTMKIDPDERLTDGLKRSVEKAIVANNCDGMKLKIRLCFMGVMLPACLNLVRLWRTNYCTFSNVSVNEHALVNGKVIDVAGELEHHDSPNLHHWFQKQNSYTTSEASMIVGNHHLSATPNLFGSGLERRMFLKKYYRHIPLRHTLMFLYCWLWVGAWRCGREGFIWARLRSDVYRFIDYKVVEMEKRRLGPSEIEPHPTSHNDRKR